VSRKFVRANGDFLYQAIGAPVTAYPITLSCWFQTPLADPGSNQVILYVGNRNSGHDSAGIFLDHGASGKISGVTEDTVGAFHTTTSNTIPAANTWYQVIYVLTNTTTRALYVNGVAAAVDDAATVTLGGTANGVTVGGDIIAAAGANGDFGGLIAEAALWNISLNTSDVSALAAGFPTYLIQPLNLKSYYPLWGTASPEPDLGGSRFNLTITGAVRDNHPPITLWTPKSPNSAILVAAAPSVVAFRKSFSKLGTAVGKRQQQGT
jgi:hypothetical protein